VGAPSISRGPTPRPMVAPYARRLAPHALDAAPGWQVPPTPDADHRPSTKGRTRAIPSSPRRAITPQPDPGAFGPPWNGTCTSIL
jgi:hypothetical protein